MRESLSPEETASLAAYAAKYGRTWKARLTADWQAGRCSGILQALRNTERFGPRGLQALRFATGEETGREGRPLDARGDELEPDESLTSPEPLRPPKPPSPTRASYMSGGVSFEDYYGGIAHVAGVSLKGSYILPLVEAALAAGDEHLNTIPLATWDRMAADAQPRIARSLKQHGDDWSLSGGVCVMKTAACLAVKGGTR